MRREGKSRNDPSPLYRKSRPRSVSTPPAEAQDCYRLAYRRNFADASRPLLGLCLARSGHVNCLSCDQRSTSKCSLLLSWARSWGSDDASSSRVDMSSSRTLGKRRVLGTASKAQPPQPIPQHVRKPSLLSPSESSISIASPPSSSLSSTDNLDISATAALQAKDNVAAASASSRLVCPICSDEMVRYARKRVTARDKKRLTST